jgi:hypothetical protein
MPMTRAIGLGGWIGLVAAVAAGCSDGAAPVDGAPPGDAASPDAGQPEAGRPPDAGSAAERCLSVGTTCTPDRGCRVGGCTFPERTTVIGAPPDGIVGHPDGVESIETTLWMDGYCTPYGPTDPPRCEVGEVGGACGGCGRCVAAGRNAAGEPITLCLLACTASLSDNGHCRDHYDCSLTDEVCVPGCASDDECRIHREDTNGDGVIDPGPAGDRPGVDRLVYDVETDAFCDDASFRCRHGGTAGAEAGGPCIRDAGCEADGTCLLPGPGFVDGYCTKLRCDLPGNACAGDGRCLSRLTGTPSCFAPCTVAATADLTVEAWIADTGGCRPGHACHWDGESGAGTPNGGCLPGDFNVITAPNVGAPCAGESGDECYSPFGLGGCYPIGDAGYCSVIDCGAPGMPSGACGAGNLCVDIDGTDGDLTLCLAGCRSPFECAADTGCLPFPKPESPTVCLGCRADRHCRRGHRCDAATPGIIGRCVRR